MGKMGTEYLTERCLMPLAMDGAEMFAFLGERCTSYSYTDPTPTHSGFYTLDCPEISETKGSTLAKAVGIAAAKLKEANFN